MSTVRPTVAELSERLWTGFPEAVHIGVEDDSAAHAGHAGAQGGAGHYRVQIVSPVFAGLRSVARHRLVYHCVGDWIPGRVHALAMTLSTPGDQA
jgi:BolA protein